jgi:hypothetical protein
MSKVLYDSEEDLNMFVDNFKKNISNIVKFNEIDKWTWCGHIGENYGIQYSSPIEDSLRTEINKLTKNQNPEWVENISNTIGCDKSIRVFNKSNG